MNKITLNNGCQIDSEGSWPRKVWVEGNETFHLKQRCGGPWCVNKNHYVFESVAYEIILTRAELKRIAQTDYKRVDKPTIAYVKAHTDEIWASYRHLGSCDKLSKQYNVSKTFLHDFLMSKGYITEKPKKAVEIVKRIVSKVHPVKQEYIMVYLASKYTRAPDKAIADVLGLTELEVKQKLKVCSANSKIRCAAEELYEEYR